MSGVLSTEANLAKTSCANIPSTVEIERTKTGQLSPAGRCANDMAM
ncbi:MAG: hypothetical protein QM811_18305 [Pirellulales bacterium]